MTTPLETAIESSGERLTCFRCHERISRDRIVVDFSSSKIIYSCGSCGNNGWRSFGAVFTTISVTDIVVDTGCPIRTSGARRLSRPTQPLVVQQEIRDRTLASATHVLLNQGNPSPPPVFVIDCEQPPSAIVPEAPPVTIHQSPVEIDISAHYPNVANLMAIDEPINIDETSSFDDDETLSRDAHGVILKTTVRPTKRPNDYDIESDPDSEE